MNFFSFWGANIKQNVLSDDVIFRWSYGLVVHQAAVYLLISAILLYLGRVQAIRNYFKVFIGILHSDN